MKQHFVTFLSPGTIVSESSIKPIDSWDVFAATKMAKGIKERHGAMPYGFYFTTKERNEGELDSHESKRSGIYYLGGEVVTLEELKSKNGKGNQILIENMQGNGWDRVIFNNNSWNFCGVFRDKDVLIEALP